MVYTNVQAGVFLGRQGSLVVRDRAGLALAGALEGRHNREEPSAATDHAEAGAGRDSPRREGKRGGERGENNLFAVGCV